MCVCTLEEYFVLRKGLRYICVLVSSWLLELLAARGHCAALLMKRMAGSDDGDADDDVGALVARF